VDLRETSLQALGSFATRGYGAALVQRFPQLEASQRIAAARSAAAQAAAAVGGGEVESAERDKANAMAEARLWDDLFAALPSSSVYAVSETAL
jgi:hypothetical protein